MLMITELVIELMMFFQAQFVFLICTFVSMYEHFTVHILFTFAIVH